MTVLKIIERSDGVKIDKYLAAYDPTVHLADGSYDGGILEFTDDITKAKTFPDAAAALEEWKRTPNCFCHAVRLEDGKFNRPLTAYTVEVVKL